MVETPRLALAKRIAEELRRREGRNLVAVGVYGSVARGTERLHSDVDLLVVVRRKRAHIGIRVEDGVLVTMLQHTPDEARAEVTGSHSGLNDALGGWRSMRAIYDPTHLLRALRLRAHHPSRTQFLAAAHRALLETYEDLGKLRDAVAAGDAEEAREMTIWFTGGAMGALFDLGGHVLVTGRRAFVELRRRGQIGRAICSLRYDPHPLAETLRIAESIWSSLLRRARRAGLSVDELA